MERAVMDDQRRKVTRQALLNDPEFNSVVLANGTIRCTRKAGREARVERRPVASNIAMLMEEDDLRMRIYGIRV